MNGDSIHTPGSKPLNTIHPLLTEVYLVRSNLLIFSFIPSISPCSYCSVLRLVFKTRRVLGFGFVSVTNFGFMEKGSLKVLMSEVGCDMFQTQFLKNVQCILFLQKVM